MSVLKSSIVAVALTLALAAPAYAQATTPPAKPPATQPPATQPPPPKPAPPVPFPQDSKIAFIDVNAIAQASTSGKEAAKQLEALQAKKMGEIQEKNKQLQALQTKLSTGGTVLNDTARGALEKDIDRLQRDIQFTQQNAQAEFEGLRNDLQAEFQKRLLPVIEDIAKEKGLYAVFTLGDAGVAYFYPGLMITDEVIKRLDAKK